MQSQAEDGIFIGVRMLDKSIKNIQQGTGMVHTSLIPVLWRQRQVDICEFQASLVYLSSSRPARAIKSDPIFFFFFFLRLRIQLSANQSWFWAVVKYCSDGIKKKSMLQMLIKFLLGLRNCTATIGNTKMNQAWFLLSRSFPGSENPKVPFLACFILIRLSLKNCIQIWLPPFFLMGRN